MASIGRPPAGGCQPAWPRRLSESETPAAARPLRELSIITGIVRALEGKGFGGLCTGRPSYVRERCCVRVYACVSMRAYA